VLTVLTLLPVSRTLCAWACDSAAETAASSHHHHGPAQDRDEAPGLSTGVRGIAEHDCTNHDAVVAQPATAVAERAQLVSPSASLAASAVPKTSRGSLITSALVQDGAPPGSAPPTTTPLALRI
jgi:hypothetical protein